MSDRCQFTIKYEHYIISFALRLVENFNSGSNLTIKSTEIRALANNVKVSCKYSHILIMSDTVVLLHLFLSFLPVPNVAAELQLMMFERT